jgi:hypothetical protein
MVIGMAYACRYLLKASFSWDTMICKRRKSSFCGFRKHFRIPWSIGVIPEFFYFLVLGRKNYFNARWWALRAGSYISFLLFLALLFARKTVVVYYSLANVREQGIIAYFEAGSSFWYLNVVNLLFVALILMIIIESIRMHAAWAPVRIVFYTILTFLMSAISVLVLALIISLTFLYIAYRIIKFFFTSRRRTRIDIDDDDSPSDHLNNRFRMFRAELYAWERERKSKKSEDLQLEKTVIRRKRPRIIRKPKDHSRDKDIPRFHPD